MRLRYRGQGYKIVAVFLISFQSSNIIPDLESSTYIMKKEPKLDPAGLGNFIVCKRVMIEIGLDQDQSLFSADVIDQELYPVNHKYFVPRHFCKLHMFLSVPRKKEFVLPYSFSFCLLLDAMVARRS